MDANSAPATPTPRPLITSILMPASCSARRTPAWYAPAVPLPLSSTAVLSCGEYAMGYASSWMVTSLVISNCRRPANQDLPAPYRTQDFAAFFSADSASTLSVSL